MKVYIDCSQDGSGGRETWLERKSLDLKICELKEKLRAVGIIVLDFTTPIEVLGFDPFSSEIEDFIRIADCVITISGEHHSLGMSGTVINAMRQYRVSGLDFSRRPHSNTDRYVGVWMGFLPYDSLESIVSSVEIDLRMKGVFDHAFATA